MLRLSLSHQHLQSFNYRFCVIMLLSLFGWFSTTNQPTPTEIIQRLEAERIEREIALHEAFAARKTAYEIANARERLPWIACGGFVTTCVSVAASYIHRNLAYSIPIVPIVTSVVYEAHYCYGEKIKLVRKIADSILDSDSLISYSMQKTTTDEVNARLKEEKESL